MCGIIGILSNTEINLELIDSLRRLQHRGQQAAGIATMDGNIIHLKKGNGLLSEVITGADLSYLTGTSGIGHVRYPTAGSANDPEQAQPFYVNSPYGIMLGHNGNLTNATQLRKELLTKSKRHLRTYSDSEILTNVLASEIEQLTTNSSLNNAVIFEAVTNLQQKVKGGYAVVSLIANYGLVAFRDNFGIRPLILGKKLNNEGYSYIVSSESCAIDTSEYEYIRDIKPGEAVIIKSNGKIESKICHPNPTLNICLFEFVYLSRADSIIEGVSVQSSRENMGKYLAQTIQNYNLDIDVVIAVPDTSRTSAIEVANYLKKEYREGFVKNSFSGRTFMLSTQKQRNLAVRNKLTPIAVEFKDKNVLLVDDSIVRGTTSKGIIDIVRKCKPKKVYLASAAPQVKFPNVYGIDMPTYNELIAHNRSDDEISEFIGADKVIFLTLDDLKKSITDLNPAVTSFDASCFDGKYITGDIDQAYLDSLLDSSKKKIE
jgi:amidophosphoribosyltransferase